MNFNETGLRVIGEADEPWFVAKEVAVLLGITDFSHFLASLKTYKQKGSYRIHTLGGYQKVKIINESAMYEMVFQSRKPQAKAFKKWVFNDLLPTLRREGKYEIEREKDEIEARLIETEDKVQELETQIATVRKLVSSTEFVKISDRIVFLGLIPHEVMGYLLSPLYVLKSGRNVPFYHPDNKKVHNRLSKISRRIGKVKKDHGQETDVASNLSRANAYTEADYIAFGDAVILEYFGEHPFDEWNVDTNWVYDDDTL